MNANAQEQAYLDALVQHQAYLYRASSQVVNELWQRFSKESNAMAVQLRDLLDELSDSEKVALAGGQYTTPHLKEIRDLINQWFITVSAGLPEAFAVSAVALAVYEANYTAALLGEKVKEQSGLKLWAKAKKTPLAGGALVENLFQQIPIIARQKVDYAIRDGINTGQTNQEIIKRIRGYDKTIDGKKVHFDGIVDQSRVEIERTVRTVRSHVANQAHNDVYTQLGFVYVKFVATLDGRTSKRCASLDQTVYKMDEAHPTPPLHPNCRSLLVPVREEGELIGRRPFVADDRKVKDIPKGDRDGIVGQVNANTSFKDWFARQDAKFQEQWLGPSRYKLYKSGDFTIDKFVDPDGQMYTLEELKKLDAQTFKEVGLL
nr:minor capsid protein [uncultured Acinetobacter sp.]